MLVESAYQPTIGHVDPSAVRAAVDRDVARFGGPLDGNVARFSRRLEKEVIPWTNEDMALGRFSSLTTIPNPDPVLAYLAQADESEWRKMERDPTVLMAKRKRQSRLLSFGSELTSPEKETPANRILFDAILANLKSIDKFGSVCRSALDPVFWGWRPFEATYASMTFKGRRIWVQRRIAEKNPEDFAYTTDRELVWTANTFSKFGDVPLTKKADRFKYFTATSGSTDNPYGVGLYRGIWATAYALARFQELLHTGVQRSVGILRAKNNGSARSNPIANASGTSISTAHTAQEIMTDLKAAIRLLTQYGILVETDGMEISFDTDIKAVNAWVVPIQECKQEIELALTGQTLTSKIDGNGSRAAAETHLTVLDSECKADAQETLQPFVNDGLIAAFLELNFGEVDPADVPKWRSKIGSQVSLDAAEKLYNMGAPIDGGRVAADAGVPLAESETGEKVVLSKSAQAQALMPEQGALPFEGDPKADPKAKKKEQEEREARRA